jgi:hypothetical protein
LTRSIRSRIERPRIENHTVSQDGKEANSTQAPGLCATIRLPGGTSERAAWRRFPLPPPQAVAVSATPRASGPITARGRHRPSVLNTLRALSDAVPAASTLSAGACGYVAWARMRECAPERFRKPLDFQPGHRRNLGVETKRATCLTCLLVLSLLASAGSVARASIENRACGPALCFPHLRGWSSSVGPGVVEGHPAAWVLVGNFRFSPDAAAHEGTPRVPRGKVLISLGDFPVTSASRHWRRVRHLRLPSQTGAGRIVSWRVRFAGRACLLGVRFGSAPKAVTRRLANARLGTVYRAPR